VGRGDGAQAVEPRRRRFGSRSGDAGPIHLVPGDIQVFEVSEGDDVEVDPGSELVFAQVEVFEEVCRG